MGLRLRLPLQPIVRILTGSGYPITITVGSGGLTINSVTISGKSAITSAPFSLNRPATYSTPPVDVATTTHNEATVLNSALSKYNSASDTLISTNTINVVVTAGATRGVGTIRVTTGGTVQQTFTLYVLPRSSSGNASFTTPPSGRRLINTIRTSQFRQTLEAVGTGYVSGDLVDFLVISGPGRLFFDTADENRSQAAVGSGGTAPSINSTHHLRRCYCS